MIKENDILFWVWILLFDVAVVFRWVMLSGDYGFSDIWKKISANIDTEE